MKIDAHSPHGNVFVVMATVRRLLVDIGREDRWPAVEARMKSGDYDHACDVAEDVSYGSICIVNRGNEEVHDAD